MLAPKRAKYRKQFRDKMKGIATVGNSLSFGSYGLKSMNLGWITARQIEAARRAMTHYTQRGGKIWIRIFPDKPMTAKPPEVGMGGGAGALKEFVAAVPAGRILFEMDGVTEQIAREAFRLAAFKLPVKTKFIKR
jgi:large subunit ribosomal protein L16